MTPAAQETSTPKHLRPKSKSIDISIPPFLRRDSKEWKATVKKTEKLREEGKTPVLIAAEDKDAAVHALAAELGFKKHQYRVHWFDDPSWVQARLDEKKARDEEAAKRDADKAARKEALKKEREMYGGGNAAKGKRERKAKARDVPTGRILWVGPNPKKEGSDAWQRWEKLRSYDRKTTEAYCFDGCNQTTLVNAVKAGKVKVLSDAEINAVPARAPAKVGAGAEKQKGKKAGGAPKPDGGDAGAARKKAAKPAKRHVKSGGGKVGRVSGRRVKKKK